MDVDLNVPDHTTISRRGQRLDVRLQPLPSSEPIDLIVDSSGLTIVGQDIDVVVADSAYKDLPGVWKEFYGLHFGLEASDTYDHLQRFLESAHLRYKGFTALPDPTLLLTETDWAI